MVSEARKQSMACMETDYSKHTYFRWKVKWRREHLGALGTMVETAPLIPCYATNIVVTTSGSRSVVFAKRENRPPVESVEILVGKQAKARPSLTMFTLVSCQIHCFPFWLN